MSEKDQNRRLTRQGVRELRDTPEPTKESTRRSTGQTAGQPEHTKRCYLCTSSSEYEASQSTRRRSRSRSSSTSSRSTVCSQQHTRQSRSDRDTSTPIVSRRSRAVDTTESESVASEDLFGPDAGQIEFAESEIEFKPDIEFEAESPSKSELTKQHSLDPELDEASTSYTLNPSVPDKSYEILTSRYREVNPPRKLASTAKPQAVPPPKSQAPVATPSKPTIPVPAASHPTSAQVPKSQIMTSGVGPLTRLQAQHTGAQDAGHRQISAANIDEATLDQTFGISPKWHFIKSNHEESGNWLESASSDSILLELLYFAHDQGHVQHRELEGQFEKELMRAIEGIEKLECLDAFYKTFVKDGRFRPTGKVSTSTKDEKHNRLFRMINADLQNLQRQHRILSMVCAGTADHEVHTLAQRENLRKLVEDLVHIVHPGDRGTYSEVYKVITEHAAYDQRMIKPQLSSLKLVAHPDIVVPFGGPILAGGSQIRCDALEHKIRAKLPSLVIKMHFSDKMQDQKWPDLSKPDDSGVGSGFDGTINNDDIPLPTGSSTPAGPGRPKGGKDDKTPTGSKSMTATSTGSSGSRSGKRKQVDETPPPKTKRHREDINYETPPPDTHVINEIYSEHVAQLICSLAQTPVGYLKHCKHPVASGDERDGTASVTVLGMIVSGEDIYLTKLDASHDYLDSLVETFRMDQLSFSCLANPLNLYKGTHLRALLMFLRYACLNFPRTTFFLSD